MALRICPEQNKSADISFNIVPSLVTFDVAYDDVMQSHADFGDTMQSHAVNIDVVRSHAVIVSIPKL